MYEAYSDYQSMMNLAEEIVTQCALAVHGKLTIDYQVNSVLTDLKCYWSGVRRDAKLTLKRHLILINTFE